MKRPSAGESIISSAKEALRWAKGEDVPGLRVTTVMVPEVDVRKVRRKLKFSQSEFAARFGFSRGVVRNWEQGRNRPDGAARVLLAVIDRHPEAVEDSLRKRPGKRNAKNASIPSSR
jgi:putative transcriptional regulator